MLIIMLCSLRGYSQDIPEVEGVHAVVSDMEERYRATADSLLAASASVDTVALRAVIDSVRNSGLLDSLSIGLQDSTAVRFPHETDSLAQMVPPTKGRFIPDPKKALWLAIIFPGGGQIYNRKYWKLPLLYGGFIGCIYAMNWNNTMYRDYSQAYIDIMDSDENTKSYENFIPARYDIQANKTRLKDMFKRKKNYYRRFRDLSMFCMIGVYALSILDAYIDAELSSFDISRDLTLKVHPAVINDHYSAMKSTGLKSSSYGLQCSLHF